MMAWVKVPGYSKPLKVVGILENIIPHANGKGSTNNTTVYAETKPGYVRRFSVLRSDRSSEPDDIKKYNDNLIKAISAYKQENK